MELAIAIKGRLDGSVGSTMSQAVAHAKQMKDQLRVANREMASLQKQAAKQQSSKGYVEYDTELAMLQAQVKKIALAKEYEAITDRINAKQKASANWSQAVSNLAGTAMKTAVLAAPLVGATKAAMEFESEMAEIRKVVDFDTPEQFKQMGQDILDLSTKMPMAASGIAKIVAAGGQAGIAKEDLLEFAQDAVKMGVAFDLTADQAGDMMAKWRSAFDLNQDGVVALADKINYLGNTTAASAPLISDVVTRIGPLGEIGGVASGEIAALGATMIQTGTKSDVAATGIKNLILGMSIGEKATKSQAAAFQQLGFDAADMAKRMQTDAKGAILDVFHAIQALPKDQQAGVLKDLFGEESIGAISPLLSKLNLLEDNFNKVSDATKYGGSVDAEYAARCETTANQMYLFKNSMTAVAIEIGSALLPAINSILRSIVPVVVAFANWAKEHQVLIQTMVALVASFAGVLLAARSILAIRAGFNMLKETANLFFIVNKNGETVLRGSATASKLFHAGLNGLGAAFRLAATGARALAMALMANPIIAIVAVIIAVVAAIIYFWNTNEQFRAAVIAIWNNIVSFGMSLFSALAAFFTGVWNGLVAIATAVWSGIMTVATMAVSVIMDIISAFGAFFTGVWNGCLAIASAVWDAISSFVSGAASVIEGIISALVDYISSAWDSAVAAVQSFASSVIDAIGQAVDWAMDKWSSLVNALSHPIDTAINIAQNITRTISEATSSGDDVSENARGGIYQRGAFLTTFAEDSAEAAIPLDGSARAISLWQQAGAALGVMPKTPQRMSAGTAKAPMYSNSSITLDFRPTINVQGGGDVASAVRQALEEQARQFQRELPKMLDKVSAGRRRLSYE
ncbi:phage tail tape measure protein [Megasphaera elsdenii]|uniref:phage tail tape measure protein n=1 Tax=Megasphaera elsdenii TaxID=907 RepID=UPI001D02863C|nr:phage tail tape measure protein [Megasphaera elsdenii]MCB5727645.1 phage tail tape measure protein [Megasphaera elsdenii]MCB5771424.1 phage tail tape measure protein [Megasphaera elsdenii]